MNCNKMAALTLLLSLAATIAARDQKGDAVKADMKMLQGVWQVTKWIDSSELPAPPDEVKAFTFEFKEDRVIQRKGDRAREPLKVILNPSKKPKWIEFDYGTDVGEKMQGIYKLEGDELTICVISGSRTGQPPERPTEFKASEKKFHTLLVMKKVKKS